MKWLGYWWSIFNPPPPHPSPTSVESARNATRRWSIKKLRFKGVDHPSSNKIPWEFRAQWIKLNITILTRLPNKMTKMDLPVLSVFESADFMSCTSLHDPFTICLFMTTTITKTYCRTEYTGWHIGCAGDDETSQFDNKPLVLLASGLTDRH